MKRKILICNDDGIAAEGILAITSQLNESGKYDIRVASPATEQSAKSHSITIEGEIIAEKYELPAPLQHIPAWRVHGTPVDCIKVVLFNHIYGSEWSPDLIISGINKGINSGASIYYSGTVSVAKEGIINGVPSIALSVHFEKPQKMNFQLAAKYSNQLVDYILDNYEKFYPLLVRSVINVNIPNCFEDEVKGWKVTKQGFSNFKDAYTLSRNIEFDELQQPIKKAFTLRGYADLLDNSIEFDTFAVFQNYISVTPLGMTYLNPHIDNLAFQDSILSFLSS